MKKIDPETDMLLVVDVQNDFVTGSLAVPGAIEIIPIINKLREKIYASIYSMDAHIEGHPSFQAQGGPWPDHCVIGSYGHKLHNGLEVHDGITMIVEKGLKEEAFSAFAGFAKLGGTTTPEEILEVTGTKRLFICGLATDYCVKATVLDALKLFAGKVYVIRDAIRAVNILEDDGDKAIEEMGKAGAKIITSNYLGN